jgi:NADP-dependent 3-hydroxy acid dehydrogenase YdfG
MLVHALRLELNGEPIRVTEIAPGMVFTPEFTSTVSAATRSPQSRSTTGSTAARGIRCRRRHRVRVERPGHVNLDLVTMRPVAQSAQHLLARGALRPRG